MIDKAVNDWLQAQADPGYLAKLIGRLLDGVQLLNAVDGDAHPLPDTAVDVVFGLGHAIYRDELGVKAGIQGHR